MHKNNYLFASQFIKYLVNNKLEEPDLFNSFKNTIKNYSEQAIDNFTDLILKGFIAQLKFASRFEKLDNYSIAYLYEKFPLDKIVSCLIIVEKDKLDNTFKGDYPVFNLIQLLKINKLEWGILTDGIKWRLYSTLSFLPYENFIEVDFSNPIDEDYIIFYKLFTQHLFIPDENDITPLEKFIIESEKEAKIIESHIKAGIDGILENITFGFLNSTNRLNTILTEEEKKEYFDNSAFLLFRMLFIFYAESRELLPIKDIKYYNLSLNYLLDRAKNWQQEGIPNPNGTELWFEFRDLCDNINFGNNEFGIAEYDGGLFDSRKHKFLNEPNTFLTNNYFVNILTALGYFTKKKEEIRINYKDLSVRSIGALYEGILEYKLFLAEEDMVIRGKDIITKNKAGILKKTDREIPKGHPYFSQDAAERHDSGSYYTPEDVVNYMVQNSVRLGLEEKWIELLPDIKKYERELLLATSEDLKKSLLKKFDNLLLSFIKNVILKYRVIDPAMGSGHFLVNVLNTITHFIIEVLQHKITISDGQIKHDKEIIEIKWDLFEHINTQIFISISDYRRQVVQNCIFGIDLNYLTSELAKLSLWIASAEKDKPLTFLDHHLKCGNSVIGAKLKDIYHYPSKNKKKDFEQLLFAPFNKFENIKAVFNEMLELKSDTIENINEKKIKYSAIKDNIFLLMLNDIATIWVALSYNINGNDSFSKIKSYRTLLLDDESLIISDTRYNSFLEKFSEITNVNDWIQLLGVNLKNEIEHLKNKYNIFHWEFEFPEICNIGFDATVGNPPYVDVNSQDYIGLQFLPLTSNNLYAYILSNSLNYLKNDARLSLIIPMSIVVSKRMEDLRSYLINSESTKYFVNIDSMSHPGTIFQNVNIQITIFFSICNNINQIFSTNYYRFYQHERRFLFKKIKFALVKQEFMLNNVIPKISNQIELDILYKVIKKKKSILDFLDEKVYKNTVFYKSAGNPFYRLAFLEAPNLMLNGESKISSSVRTLNLVKEINRNVVASIFMSSLFYWFWIVFSDCFNFTQGDLKKFKIDLLEIDQNEFNDIYEKICSDLKKNGKVVTYNKTNGVTQYFEYRPRESKYLFDKIDSLLAKYYSFTHEELQYLINYDYKYRTVFEE